ncbi:MULTISPECIES: hypothetical protein [Pseudomonas]|uniref:Phage protein n=2 Tax=Pseudomonas TaxID=286 RepID=A0AAX0VUT8_9PSED|nr:MULTISPECIES: hypothetical protein [Pseudomonas]MDM9592844.1 hypothetical protein [Pseudomonas guariconensis]MDM9605671.1 hypothetical protein [Pseudomonas guariconensis]MDM9610628.1 hypothetical protein [Pseudomonas guariconensis]PLV17695.1 hypothetical protein CXG49_18365 [Pseudomonas guariconensis]PLV22464.1 hypothetical protein CXG53_19440 [Pseudomonas guariconensis]
MSELATLHAALTATIREAIPELASVDIASDVESSTVLPSLRHGIVRMTADAAPRDGRSVLVTTFEADITPDLGDPDARLQGSLLAAQLMDLLRQQYWGLDFVEASRNALAQFEGGHWIVRWEQPVLLGEPQWHWPDQPPGMLMLGIDPDTGSGNEHRYIAAEDIP